MNLVSGSGVNINMLGRGVIEDRDKLMRMHSTSWSTCAFVQRHMRTESCKIISNEETLRAKLSTAHKVPDKKTVGLNWSFDHTTRRAAHLTSWHIG